MILNPYFIPDLVKGLHLKVEEALLLIHEIQNEPLCFLNILNQEVRNPSAAESIFSSRLGQDFMSKRLYLLKDEILVKLTQLKQLVS